MKPTKEATVTNLQALQPSDSGMTGTAGRRRLEVVPSAATASPVKPTAKSGILTRPGVRDAGVFILIALAVFAVGLAVIVAKATQAAHSAQEDARELGPG